jgi:hypothetical protein
MLHEAHLLPQKYLKFIAEKERKYLQIVKHLISDFLGGNIQEDELTVITFSLFGMCNWIYSWYNLNGPISPQQLSKIICNIFSEGLNKWRKINKENG